MIPFGFLLTGMPTISGVSEMDYPLQGPGLLSAPNLPELSAVRRIPLPPELVEQFSRILLLLLLLVLILHFYEFLEKKLDIIYIFQLNQLTDMQCNCMMGVFPEICRAWLTIDNDIFMWNYEDG